MHAMSMILPPVPVFPLDPSSMKPWCTRLVAKCVAIVVSRHSVKIRDKLDEVHAALLTLCAIGRPVRHVCFDPNA
eukprot:UN2649